MYKYDPKSLKAEEFINHEEILASIEYAKANKSNKINFAIKLRMGDFKMYKYDPKSLKAEEFINHEEILASIEYAKANKSNRELIESILQLNYEWGTLKCTNTIQNH